MSIEVNDTTNAVIVPGKPSREDFLDPDTPPPHKSKFFPWLKTLLVANQIPTEVLVMPKPYSPEYVPWRSTVERQKVGRGTICFGYSAGGDLKLHWLSERQDIVIMRLVLIALWSDFPREDLGGRRKYGNFSDYELDPGLGDRVTDGITVLASSDDPDPNVHRAVERLTSTVRGVEVIEFDNYGHFKVPEIPELVGILGLNNQSPTEPSSS